MKAKLILLLMLIFILPADTKLISAFKVIPNCGEIDDQEITIPRYDITAMEEKINICFGKHYVRVVTFHDQEKTQGELFIGGISEKYFIAGASNPTVYNSSYCDKTYYKTLQNTVKALYIYRKYGCITQHDD